MSPLRPAALLTAAALLSACSSSRPVAPPPPPVAPAPTVDIAATETVDLAPYLAETPPAPPAPLTHEVPEDLMANAVREAPRPAAPAPRPATPAPRPGALPPVTTPSARPAAPVYRAVQGYRVQVVQVTSRPEAERAVQNAVAWWRRARGGQPEVYLVYRAPYYRVRVGNFRSRGDADAASRQLTSLFPNAFSVPDRVTVRVMEAPVD